jgi:hypothetical protein
VWLIVFYCIFMVVGDLAAYFIGLGVERAWPAASLPVFLFLYFLFLWVSWILAVKVTEPKEVVSSSRTAG